MKNKLIGLASILIVGTLSACSTVAINKNSTSSQITNISLSQNTNLGNIMTDNKGMTLYFFAKDSIGNSVCEGECLEKWPIFYDTNIVAGEGLNTNDFSSIKRNDAKMQTTYKGLPLYYFFKDTNTGDTNGQGLKDVWFVAQTDYTGLIK